MHIYVHVCGCRVYHLLLHYHLQSEKYRTADMNTYDVDFFDGMKGYIEIADNTRLILTYLMTAIFDDTKISFDIFVLQRRTLICLMA